MSAVLEVREPGARYLDALKPPLVRHFGLVSTAPVGVARLRELILDLAIRGRLIPRDLNTASQVADATVDDSGPFELPEGWSWRTLGALEPELQNGASSRGDAGGQPTTVLRLADIKNRRVSLADTRQVPIRRQDIEKYRLRDGDILITRVNGSADIVGQFNLVEGEPPAIYCDHFIRMRVSRDVLDPKYLALFGGSEVIRSRISNLFISTAGQKTVNQGHIGSLPIAIPPLAEQARIITRVDELMRLCDALEAKGRLEAEQHARLLGALLGTLTDSTTPEELAANWQRVADHFDLLLDRPEAVDALEQTILQLAVRGLLVPQDPIDEPASGLLERIDARRRRNQKKPLSEMAALDPAEAPYELPSLWTWTQLGDLVENMGSGWSPACEDGERTDPARWAVLRTTAVQVMEYRAHEHKAIPLKFAPRPEIEVQPGDILVTRAGPMNRVGISCWVDQTPSRLMLSDKIVRFHPVGDELSPAFLVMAMNAGWTRELLEAAKTGMAASQVNVSQSDLKSLWVPVCSRNEQARVVARVEELRRLCTDLRQRLTASQTTQSHLAEALVDEVA